MTLVELSYCYELALGYSPETGELIGVLHPEIPIIVHGPERSRQLQALVDTGADYTVLPMSVATDCGISVTPGKGPAVRAFGGRALPTSFGEVQLELQRDATVIHWNAVVHFFEFPSLEDESVVLGHSGFLDHFDATFCGQTAMLMLKPVDERTPASAATK